MIIQARKGDKVTVKLNATIPLFNISWEIGQGDICTVQPAPDLMSAEVRDIHSDDKIEVIARGYKSAQNTLPFSQTFTIIVNNEQIQARF